MRETRAWIPLLAVVTLWRCGGGVPLTAPEGATISMQANPTSISANGGRSTITIVGFKGAADGGGTLPDGTQIFLTTNLGVIEERVEMRDGIARATLQADGRSGTATIRATSGTLAVQETTVEIGTVPEMVITVTANPATLGPTDFTSEIVATVTDGRGNPLPDVPVIFRTDAGSLASAGSVLRTNSSGQAFDRLTLLDDDGNATVTVSSGSVSNTVQVTRGTFDEPSIDFVSPISGSPGTNLTVTIAGRDFQGGATASFGAGISVNEVTYVNSETLLADITISPFAALGARTVTVTNPDDGAGELTDGFAVTGSAPVCRMSVFDVMSGSGTSADPWIMTGQLVDFNGTASSDPDGGPLTFDWNVGDPPTAAFTDPAFTYTFSAVDTFQVVLTVTDDEDETCVLVRFLTTT